MENQHPNPVRVLLSMNISCCAKCPTLLERKLLKMKGVQKVAIYVQENLVSVTGIMDPTTLFDQVASYGKEVKLISTDHNYHNKNKHHVEEMNTEREEGHHHHQHAASPQHYPRTRQNQNLHGNCCCQDGRHHDHGRKKAKEEVHKCESYVPIQIDPRVCRSIYCKDHVKMQKVTNNVTPESSTFFGTLYNEFGGSYPYRDPYYYQRQQMEMPEYGYGRGMSRMLPGTFGYRPGNYYS